ncbi:MAG: ComF family protein [Patescibacteria group bacterium]
MEGYRALILDAVFPRRCVSCSEYGAWCCDACFEKIERVHRDPCVKCGLLNEHECDGEETPLDALIVIGFYHDPILRALLHALKYHSATELREEFTRLIRQAVQDRNRPWPWAGESSLALQAVIASPDRIRSRGFDQAELIRDILKQELLPWATPSQLLLRSNTESAQADLEVGILRTANVKGIFSLFAGSTVPEAVLLIDDVYTTGSTMKEAARILKAAGTKRIYGFAIAMGK